MLFLTRVDIWNTKKPGHRLGQALWDYFLLNTNRLSEMKVKLLGTTVSKFLYSQDPDDARDSPDTIECRSTIAVIRGWHDAVANSKFVTLPIFPDMDITKTAVNTTIEWDDITAIWQTYADFVRDICHCIYYNNAWKRIECIVDLNLWEVLILQNAH